VIVLGETGTGKGLVARALHADSRRRDGALVSVNCASLPEALLESELFGHLKGSFTGAVTDRPGLFTEADGGSLFLDEVADMTPVLQAMLLDVIESGSVRPVGATKPRQVDVRIIAATHRDLNQAVREGKFREDLMYRLDVITIMLPPLRDRPEDIPELIEHFLDEGRQRYPGAPIRRFAPGALDLMRRYRWPGNVRELSHAVEKLTLLVRTEEITPEDLPENIVRNERVEALQFHGDVIPIWELERRYALWAVAQTGGHRGRAAEKLGVDPKTLRKWLDQVERDGEQ
jgi:two-component system response regulator HydG